MSAWNSDPVVVTVAVTGADVFRENNPNIPYTTEEIADSSDRGGARRAPPSRTCTCARTTARRAAAPSCSST